MATVEEMHIASEEAINELRIMLRDDPAFAEQMSKFAKFLRKWFMKAGYKQIARFVKDLK